MCYNIFVMKAIHFFSLTFIAFSLVALASCQSEKDPEPVDCTVSDLAVVADVNDATTCESNDGSVTVSANGGITPYEFRLNDDAYQSEATFTNLAPGVYTITVKDGGNCESNVEITINSGSSPTLAFVSVDATHSGCGTSESVITVNATGEGTVMYKLDDGAYQASGSFENIAAGIHDLAIMDDTGCETTSQKQVLNGTSFNDHVKDILLTNCAISGCHDGSNGSERNWTVFSNVKNKAARIKSKTQDGSMPPGDRVITQEQIDLIACWVDDGALEN